jgi:uncharacterized protein involved in cysteine biosynthesis
MLAALAQSFAQLKDRAVLGVLVRALLLTLLLFAVAAAGIFRIAWSLDTRGWPALLAAFWTGGGNNLAAVVLTLLLLWLSFTALATGVISLWLDEIIVAVERRYYPARPGTPLGLAREARLGLAAFFRVLLWNGLCLPLYLLLMVTGVGPLILFLIVNAWLLGREYLESVAARHLPAEAAAAFVAANGRARWATGAVAAGLFALPLFNLVAPIIAVAFATHMFHRQAA